MGITRLGMEEAKLHYVHIRRSVRKSQGLSCAAFTTTLNLDPPAVLCCVPDTLVNNRALERMQHHRYSTLASSGVLLSLLPSEYHCECVFSL